MVCSCQLKLKAFMCTILDNSGSPFGGVQFGLLFSDADAGLPEQHQQRQQQSLETSADQQPQGTPFFSAAAGNSHNSNLGETPGSETSRPQLQQASLGLGDLAGTIGALNFEGMQVRLSDCPLANPPQQVDHDLCGRKLVALCSLCSRPCSKRQHLHWQIPYAEPFL